MDAWMMAVEACWEMAMGACWQDGYGSMLERNLSIWVHSSVVRAADCRSAGPWFKSGCALLDDAHMKLCANGLKLCQRQTRNANSAVGN